MHNGIHAAFVVRCERFAQFDELVPGARIAARDLNLDRQDLRVLREIGPLHDLLHCLPGRQDLLRIGLLIHMIARLRHHGEAALLQERLHRVHVHADAVRQVEHRRIVHGNNHIAVMRIIPVTHAVRIRVTEVVGHHIQEAGPHKVQAGLPEHERKNPEGVAIRVAVPAAAFQGHDAGVRHPGGFIGQRGEDRALSAGHAGVHRPREGEDEVALHLPDPGHAAIRRVSADPGRFLRIANAVDAGLHGIAAVRRVQPAPLADQAQPDLRGRAFLRL